MFECEIGGGGGGGGEGGVTTIRVSQVLPVGLLSITSRCAVSMFEYRHVFTF